MDSVVLEPVPHREPDIQTMIDNVVDHFGCLVHVIYLVSLRL
jgi:hypothetical protein